MPPWGFLGFGFLLFLPWFLSLSALAVVACVRAFGGIGLGGLDVVQRL